MAPLLGALSALVCSSSIAQTARFDGETLVVTDGKRHMRIEKAVESGFIHEVVHAVKKRGDDYFILIGVSEWTRGSPSPRGNCGAGVESHIDWMRVRDGKIIERQSGLYESCAKNRVAAVIEWRRGTLYWAAEGQRNAEDEHHFSYVPVDYSWTFDSAHPEKGIEEHAVDSTSRQTTTIDKSTPSPALHPPANQ